MPLREMYAPVHRLCLIRKKDPVFHRGQSLKKDPILHRGRFIQKMEWRS